MKLKISRKNLFVLTAFFCFMFLSKSVSAWWTDPKNTHYLMTLCSHSQLARIGLLYENELRGGANSPDKIHGLAKTMQHHRHFHRANINFNAAVDIYNKGNYKQAAWVLSSAFHYLQDAIDFSTMFSGDYTEGIRSSCYEILSNWQEVMSYPDMKRVYYSTYSSEYSIMKNYDLKQIVRRAQNKRLEHGRSLKSTFDYLERSGGLSESDAKKMTKEVLKAIATIQAGQDRIIELFMMRTGRR